MFALVGLAIHHEQLPELTREFLDLKRRSFPGLAGGGARLDAMLWEVKGSDLRKDVRRGGRDQRAALVFLDRLLGLVEKHQARLFGRIWVKGIAQPFNGRSVYTSSVQSMCGCFDHLLAARGTHGAVILDSGRKGPNTVVSHSIFTKMFQATGSAYPNLVDLPTFGHSDNHAGLQVCDLVVSALLWPMAVHVYCTGYITSVHVNAADAVLVSTFGQRLKALQHRYPDGDGRWRGGLTVSDAIAQRSGGLLFGP